MLCPVHCEAGGRAPFDPGPKLVFERDGKIYITGLNSINPRLVSEGSQPHITAAGDRIVFCTADEKLAVYDVKSGWIRILQENTHARYFEPQWPPNGKKIVFRIVTDNWEELIGVVDGNGKGLKYLSENMTRQYRRFDNPTWAWNGSTFVFT